MLYPTFDLDPAQRQIEIPSGTLGILPLILEPGGEITFQLQQLFANPQNLPQDRSFRVWVSDKPGGRSLMEGTPHLNTVTLTALMPTIIVIHDYSAQAPVVGVGIPAMPGSYWLNVLNLVNEANSLSLEII